MGWVNEKDEIRGWEEGLGGGGEGTCVVRGTVNKSKIKKGAKKGKKRAKRANRWIP